MKKERRYHKAELRAKRGDSGNTIGGYAAKFNVISEDLGGFREVLLPGCFDLDNSPDITCNREHDDCKLLGRSTSGTLQVTADEIGLAFECLVPNTEIGRETVELIERGDLSSCSFAFVISDGGEEWGETDDGQRLRKISKVTLFDCSCVIHPAYPDTELALRSLKRHEEKRSRANYNRARLRMAETPDA